MIQPWGGRRKNGPDLFFFTIVKNYNEPQVIFFFFYVNNHSFKYLSKFLVKDKNFLLFKEGTSLAYFFIFKAFKLSFFKFSPLFNLIFLKFTYLSYIGNLFPVVSLFIKTIQEIKQVRLSWNKTYISIQLNRLKKKNLYPILLPFCSSTYRSLTIYKSVSLLLVYAVNK